MSSFMFYNTKVLLFFELAIDKGRNFTEKIKILVFGIHFQS